MRKLRLTVALVFLRITGATTNMAGGMGQAFGSKGSVNDNTNGLTPVVVLSQSGANLPYVANSNAAGAYNGQSFNYNAYHEPVGGSYQWNVRAERQIGNNVVASLGYVATHGHN